MSKWFYCFCLPESRRWRASVCAVVAGCFVIVAVRAAEVSSATVGNDSAPQDQNSGDQNPSSAGSSQQGTGPRLEEIVITAQRRTENLQQVPISAQVIGGQTLSGQNLNSLADLAQTVPSINIGGNAGLSNTLYIRGIGSGVNQDFDQAVGLFIDDVYHGRSRVSGATFLDLDRVEVLNGPQSTFFGNNAIAGALNIVTKKSGDAFDASARALYGMYGQYVAEGAVGGPITDTLGARLAVTTNGGSGWIKNIDTGDYGPDAHNEAGRLTLLFKPTQDLEATLKGEVSENKSNPGYGQRANCPSPAPFVTTGTCSAALGLNLPVGVDNNENSGLPGQVIDLSTVDDVLTINYRQWGQTFTSVSGFYAYHYDGEFDLENLPTPQLTGGAPEKYHQFSQELRIASPTNQPIEYLLGGYFQTDRLFYREDVNLFLLTPVVSSIPPFAPLVPYLPLGQEVAFSQGEHNHSVFGSVSWNATDSLKITGGFRGSWVDKDYTQNVFVGTVAGLYGPITPLPLPLQPFPAALGLGTPSTLQGSRSDNAWMPSGKIQYQIDPEAMVYARYDRGFLAGGFNGSNTSGIAANLPFDPEYVNAYEVGLKSEWLDRRTLINLAVFRSNYSDLQVSTGVYDPAIGSLVTLIKNAAAARSQGVELESQWLIGDSFRVAAHVTYLEAFYVRYPNAPATTLQMFHGQNFQDLSGQPTANAPRWSGSLYGTYTVTVAGNYRLTTELSTYLSSNFYLNSGVDDPLSRPGAYARLDGRLTLQTPDRRWDFDFIGKNLTNRVLYNGYGPDPTAAGSLVVTRQAPRNVAVQARYHF